MVAATLDYSCSRKIHEARRLREGDTPLPGEASRALDDLLEVLQLYGPAREHVKTLYFQWELANLSRAILSAAVPALVVAIAGVLLVSYVLRIVTVTKRTLAIGPFVVHETDDRDRR